MSEHEQEADRLEREARELEERSERVGSQISDTREDWERKRADNRVPGALPREGGDQPAEDGEREPWPDE